MHVLIAHHYRRLMTIVYPCRWPEICDSSSRWITAVTKQLKKYLSKHNASGPVVNQLSWEATNLSGQSANHSVYTASEVPNKLKYQAVRLCHQNVRATGDCALKCEMKNW